MLGLVSKNSIVLMAALVALMPLTAKADAELLWRNAKGFVSAETCQIVQQTDSDLRRVLSSGAVVNAKKSNLSAESAVPLNEDVFEIKGTSLPIKIGQTGVVTKGSFWQVSLTEDGQYLTYQCEERGQTISYTVFDVFTSASVAPLARVGVQGDETAIFQVTQVYKPEDADKKLDALAAAAAIPGNMSSASGSASNSKSLPRLKIPVAPAPTIEPSGTHEISCFGGSGGEVLDETLTKVLFTAAPKEKMIAVQSWSKNRLEKTVNGKSVGFVRILFPDRDRSANAGYIAESAIKSRATCEVSSDDDDAKDLRSKRHGRRTRGSRNQKRYKRAMTLGGAPLSKKVSTGVGVFEFPTYDRPQSSYLEGGRRFHAGRKGRLHAACDLYRPHGEGVVAIADGVVITSRYLFYQDVFAIEIRLANGSIARYGEILGRLPPGIRLGARVKKGQTVGYVGTVTSGCCHPMLHFELYSGKAKGPLTIRGRSKKSRKGHKRSAGGGSYQRRADLMNPTTLLRTWEKSDFGLSY